jgi:arsenical pump membrane protein
MLSVAVITAVLNLDTSVVFMTPIAINAARTKGTDETAFLYGTIFMSNSASLLLVGSNLTNLLIFARRDELGVTFARHMALPWLAAVVVTTLVVGTWRWRTLRHAGKATPVADNDYVVGPGVAAVGFAIVAMLVIPQPAIWVFTVGAVAEMIALARRRGSWRDAVTAANPGTLAILFVLAVAVGWFARWSSLTKHLLMHANLATTAAASALSSLVINNLPAASLFAAHGVRHPFALLLGLDLGPNCAVTGALSSLLWLRIARRHDLRPSIVTFSAIGVVIAVVSISISLTLL